MTQTTSTTRVVGLRCPDGVGGLLAKIKLLDGYARVNSDNLLEISCRNCRKNIAELTNQKILLVTHSFDVAGRFVETNITYDE